MSDADGDSTMHSSPSDVDETEEVFPNEQPAGLKAPATPTGNDALQAALSSELSPPNSQSGPTSYNAFSAVPRSGGLGNANGSPSNVLLNANGKRVMMEGKGERSVTVKSGKPLGESNSGYQWSRPEDEPGFAWLSRKAQEECGRALEQIIDKDCMIRNRYGDVCEKSQRL